MKGEFTVGIVTVTYNSESVFQEFWDSLSSQTLNSYKLYVVDNASTDHTLDVLKSRSNDGRITVIKNQSNMGVAEGNNQGIQMALRDGCELILLLNNDTVFGEDLLVQLCGAIINADMVTPKILYFDDQKRLWFAGGHFAAKRGYAGVHRGLGEHDRGQYDDERSIDYAPTCCLLIKREVFARIGLMDSKYFVYYDDVDFCWRARRAGVRMQYIPRVALFHKVSSLTGGEESSFGMRFNTRNKVYFLRKHFAFPKKEIFILAYFCSLFLRYLKGVDSWPIYRLRVRAFFEGIRV